MRPTFLFSCMIFIIMSFSFCTKLLDADKKLTDDNIPNEEETLFHHNGDLEDTISAESTTLSIPFLFTATEDWEAMSSNDSWLIVNTSNGEAKERITLDISTRKNIKTKAKTRRARIFVKTSQDSFSLYIIQQVVDGSLPTEGNGTLVYDKSYDLDQSIYADATTLNADFVFKATESWTAVSSDKSWLTVSPMGDKGSDISLAVFTSNNRTEAERTATIILSTSEDEVILTVTQLHTIDEDGTTFPPSTATLIYDTNYDFTPILYAGDIALPTPFLFEATLAWDVTKENVIGLNADWVIIDPVNGAIGSGISLGVTTIPNVTGNTRVATVRLFTSEDEVSLIITQRATDEDGNGTLVYDNNYDLEQSILADDETLNEDFVFTATERWTAVSNDSWLIVNTSNGEAKKLITLDISTEKNGTTTERTATITLSTSKDEVILDEVVLTVTQLGIVILTVSTPQESVNIEGFRKNTKDVKAYNVNYGGGHDAGEGYNNNSGGGGYIIHDFQEERTEYIPYNITLSNPDDYEWQATSSFNIKDAGLVSSVDYTDDATTSKIKVVTGSNDEGVYLFIDVTGPGDKDITGTLTIKAIPKDRTITEVFEKQFALTITTNCGIGETTTASLVWDDRNRGVHVPDKEVDGVATVAGYFTNADAEENGGEGHDYLLYKGDYYEWENSIQIQSVCPVGWHPPTENEFSVLVSTDMRFSKSRAFVVSDVPDGLVYTGAWFPLAGTADDSGDVYGRYWSGTAANANSYSLHLFPTGAVLSSPDYVPNGNGYSVRCVKDIAQ